MIIGENGPVNQAQIDKAAQEAAEAKRLKAMSNEQLVGEIRKAQRTTGATNHLCFALAAGLLCLMDAPLEKGGNDPYRLKWSGTRAKTSRSRSTPSAPKVGA